MKAKFPGTCACSARFLNGDEITYSRAAGKVTACPSCAATTTPVRDAAPVNALPHVASGHMQSRFTGRCQCNAEVVAGTEILYSRQLRKVIGCPSCDFGRAKANAQPAVAPTVALGSAVDAAVTQLTEEQRAVVTRWNGGYARLLATAGSGKTRVLAVLLGRLVRDGIPPAAILATSFTVKAAREIHERAIKLFGVAVRDCTVGTFHSLVRGWLVEHFANDKATVNRIQNPFDGGGKVDAKSYDADDADNLPRSLNQLAKALIGAG